MCFLMIAIEHLTHWWQMSMKQLVEWWWLADGNQRMQKKCTSANSCTGSRTEKKSHILLNCNFWLTNSDKNWNYINLCIRSKYKMLWKSFKQEPSCYMQTDIQWQSKHFLLLFLVKAPINRTDTVTSHTIFPSCPIRLQESNSSWFSNSFI
jgi:hypothetical protein